MKKLNDGTEVSSKSYFYLSMFNNTDNFKVLTEVFKKESLYELTGKEYRIFFQIATNQEFPNDDTQPTIIVFGNGQINTKDYLQLLDKVNNTHLVSPWEENAYFTGKLHYEDPPLETIHNPFVTKKLLNIGHIGQSLISPIVSTLPLIEEPPPRVDYDLFVRKNYFFNPKTGKSSRVRGKKNKDFKQSIRNLTNKQK